MILPIAIFYDELGDPVSIRYLQFTMRQDVNADFTWEYYNALVSTPYSTLDLISAQVLDIPMREVLNNVAKLSLQSNEHGLRLTNISGITRVRCDGSLAADVLQVIAIKRPANRQGTNAVAVISKEKLLTGIVEVLVVDYKGNIKRYQFKPLLELYKSGKIKLGNSWRENGLISWSGVFLDRQLSCASEAVRNQRSEMLNVAELNNNVAQIPGHDERDTMTLQLEKTETAIVPDGWLQVMSGASNSTLKTLVCAKEMHQVRLNENMLTQLVAPEYCYSFIVDGSSPLKELQLPKVLASNLSSVAALAKPELFSRVASHQSEFYLSCEVLPNQVINMRDYYDLSKMCLSVSKTAPSLTKVIMAQPRVSSRDTSNMGSMWRHPWMNSFTDLRLRVSPELTSVYFLAPKSSSNVYHSTNNSAQQIILSNAPKLEEIVIEGRSLDTRISLGVPTNAANGLTIKAHAIRKLILTLPERGYFRIFLNIRYLHIGYIRVGGHEKKIPCKPSAACAMCIQAQGTEVEFLGTTAHEGD